MRRLRLELDAASRHTSTPLRTGRFDIGKIPKRSYAKPLPRAIIFVQNSFSLSLSESLSLSLALSLSLSLSLSPSLSLSLGFNAQSQKFKFVPCATGPNTSGGERKRGHGVKGTPCHGHALDQRAEDLWWCVYSAPAPPLRHAFSARSGQRAVLRAQVCCEAPFLSQPHSIGQHRLYSPKHIFPETQTSSYSPSPKPCFPKLPAVTVTAGNIELRGDREGRGRGFRYPGERE